ncbi:MAG: rRNA (cytidine-2'-O-)-methyltransferase, partial [Gemmatimonadetes bacterium]|nr:rRNA (cytidine-2'-O-)-methyltransferase [Gemmatimonadota bacterium]NIU30742.1 rRNA (cytidine-2'-O-)-methyltransferase [Gemmatimonadota bacterium]NIU79176.1 rRNA (cytidine-2'-O-)-methyltransferase [Gammaproteobacteria bacterium]NIX47860.1 rRNA (cytidine-2'-O-)-methyltransferase [Gemmatimonadota bacterium]NIY12231.1 rRNA (cytidine-2'-O-)-methyltransferase [Gemmatimonadota bacterium]
KGGERDADLDRVAGARETVVLFESPNRLVRLLDDLGERCEAGRGVAVARELTKVHEEFVRGTLAEVAAYYRERPPRGEVTVVVGPAEVATSEDDVEA